MKNLTKNLKLVDQWKTPETRIASTSLSSSAVALSELSVPTFSRSDEAPEVHSEDQKENLAGIRIETNNIVVDNDFVLSNETSQTNSSDVAHKNQRKCQRKYQSSGGNEDRNDLMDDKTFVTLKIEKEEIPELPDVVNDDNFGQNMTNGIAGQAENLMETSILKEPSRLALESEGFYNTFKMEFTEELVDEQPSNSWLGQLVDEVYQQTTYSAVTNGVINGVPGHFIHGTVNESVGSGLVIDENYIQDNIVDGNGAKVVVSHENEPQNGVVDESRPQNIVIDEIGAHNVVIEKAKPQEAVPTESNDLLNLVIDQNPEPNNSVNDFELISPVSLGGRSEPSPREDGEIRSDDNTSVADLSEFEEDMDVAYSPLKSSSDMDIPLPKKEKREPDDSHHPKTSSSNYKNESRLRRLLTQKNKSLSPEGRTSRTRRSSHNSRKHHHKKKFSPENPKENQQPSSEDKTDAKTTRSLSKSQPKPSEPKQNANHVPLGASLKMRANQKPSLKNNTDAKATCSSKSEPKPSEPKQNANHVPLGVSLKMRGNQDFSSKEQNENKKPFPEKSIDKQTIPPSSKPKPSEPKQNANHVPLGASLKMRVTQQPSAVKSNGNQKLSPEKEKDGQTNCSFSKSKTKSSKPKQNANHVPLGASLKMRTTQKPSPDNPNVNYDAISGSKPSPMEEKAISVIESSKTHGGQRKSSNVDSISREASNSSENCAKAPLNSVGPLLTPPEHRDNPAQIPSSFTSRKRRASTDNSSNVAAKVSKLRHLDLTEWLNQQCDSSALEHLHCRRHSFLPKHFVRCRSLAKAICYMWLDRQEDGMESFKTTLADMHGPKVTYYLEYLSNVNGVKSIEAAVVFEALKTWACCCDNFMNSILNFTGEIVYEKEVVIGKFHLISTLKYWLMAFMNNNRSFNQDYLAKSIYPVVGMTSTTSNRIHSLIYKSVQQGQTLVQHYHELSNIKLNIFIDQMKKRGLSNDRYYDKNTLLKRKTNVEFMMISPIKLIWGVGDDKEDVGTNRLTEMLSVLEKMYLNAKQIAIRWYIRTIWQDRIKLYADFMGSLRSKGWNIWFTVFHIDDRTNHLEVVNDISKDIIRQYKEIDCFV